jgi:hypothetical protein
LSNPLAIAAVTATVRNLLVQGITVEAELADTTVTAQPPDRARNTATNNQINIFLYQTAVNGDLRNTDLPRQVKPGEVGQPPLPLNLYYLLTAYGRDNDDVFSHRLLGRAMSILHDHPLLGAAEVEASLPGNDLHQQLERVRITPQPLSLEEMSNLWNTFQTEYRISAAYQISVVLIESARAVRAGLPVLTRGPEDRGVPAQPDLTPPFPALREIVLPNRQESARLGDALMLVGHHLEGDAVTVRFTSPRLADPIDIAPLPEPTATEIGVQIPDDPATWVPGFYQVAILVERPAGTVRLTNELTFALAPRILAIDPNPAPRDAFGAVTLQITCSPDVRPEQRAALLLGDREVRANPRAAPTNTLVFAVPAAAPGQHFVRLRIDGVDSLLVDRSVTPPVFDQTQQVTIT